MLDAAPATRSDWACARLRTAILSGELAPGARLRSADLARRWQVSPTPLREAFQRLGGSGLVELTSQRGARVSGFSLDEAAEIYEIRLDLEPMALRKSLSRSDAPHRQAISHAYARLDLAMRARSKVVDPLEIADAHLAFHAALLSRCQSSWLRRLTALLAEHSQRYQILGTAQHRRGSDPMKEHAGLEQAAVRGQVDRAVKLLSQHLEATLTAVRVAAAETTLRPPQSRRRRLEARDGPA